ncbi:hypothetical protein CDG60_07120 [Acinetobacter chinensis]|uniref:Uncharacterized protein n=1 Tax=Acinetobacter chinensis TaxID=2004650 RepID=A0A3B7LVE1_9GAMM|nr:hypothetical protein CDG60_07120 [Acinetobacter chinensis]
MIACLYCSRIYVFLSIFIVEDMSVHFLKMKLKAERPLKAGLAQKTISKEKPQENDSNHDL